MEHYCYLAVPNSQRHSPRKWAVMRLDGSGMVWTFLQCDHSTCQVELFVDLVAFVSFLLCSILDCSAFVWEERFWVVLLL